MDEEEAVLALARAYNAGSVNSKHIPERYMQKVWGWYTDGTLLEKLVTLPEYMR
jgi:hypothetical protein